jgi:hypothetical protein
MATFNFLKEAQLYIVSGGLQYNIDIESISFSQTFTDNSYSVKTLHDQDMFEGSVINKANPANFEFKTFFLKENDLDIVIDRLVDYNTFDLYISTQLDVFKLEYAVITNGSFVIEKSQPLSITISGEASKLSKVGTAGSYTIPGTVQSRSASRTFLRNTQQTITLDGSDISSEVYRISAELQNEVAWDPYTTVHGAISATNAATSMFPSSFTVSKRILAGNIGRYVSSSNIDSLQDWSSNSSLVISVGEVISSTLFGLQLNMPSCSFTNRLEVGPVYTQNYDWRLIDNTTALSSIITKLN